MAVTLGLLGCMGLPNLGPTAEQVQAYTRWYEARSVEYVAAHGRLNDAIGQRLEGALVPRPDLGPCPIALGDVQWTHEGKALSVRRAASDGGLPQEVPPQYWRNHATTPERGAESLAALSRGPFVLGARAYDVQIPPEVDPDQGIFTPGSATGELVIASGDVICGAQAAGTNAGAIEILAEEVTPGNAFGRTALEQARVDQATRHAQNHNYLEARKTLDRQLRANVDQQLERALVRLGPPAE